MRCDTDKGPCACGAWHVMPASDKPVKTLLKAAKDLRAAQQDYMMIRGADVSPAVKEIAGQRVAEEAAELDRAIEETEKRQAAPLRAIHGMPVLESDSRPHFDGPPVREPSLSEQREMGVHPSGGEIIP